MSIHNYTFRTKNPFPVTSLEPGTKTEGMVVFGIRDKDKPTKIIYDDKMGNRISRNYKDAILLGMEWEFKDTGIWK